MNVTSSRDNLDAALRALESGDIDSLRPEDIARLENLLNEDPGIADQLADAPATPDAAMRDALGQEAARSTPTDEQWNRVWSNIERETAAPRAVRRVPWTLRLWKPMTAAAACLALFVAWWTYPAGGPVEDYPVMLATEIEIHDLEVHDDAMPFVFNTGGEQPVEVIWVVEMEGEAFGA